MSKSYQWSQYYDKQIGERASVILKRVLNKMIFESLQRQGKHICFRCGNPTTEENWSIEHMTSWVGKEDRLKEFLFMSPENLTVSCHRHNLSAGGKSNRKNDGYKGTEIVNKEKLTSRCYFNYKGRQIRLGTFDTEDEAAQMVDLANLKYHNETHDLNFPNKLEWYREKLTNGLTFEKADIEILQIENGEIVTSMATGIGKSKYKGVSYRKNKNRTKDVAQMRFNKLDGKVLGVSNGKSEEELAELYDLCVLKYRDGKGGLNFPLKVAEYNERLYNNPNIV